MLRATFSPAFAFVVVLTAAAAVHAQFGYHPNYPHIDYVPHTTTHIDAVRHGNHYHYIPHTTTHLDPVLHAGRSYQPYSYPSYRTSYRLGYGSSYSLPHSSLRSSHLNRRSYGSTHLDLIPHGNHYHVVPHTTYGHRHHHH